MSAGATGATGLVNRSSGSWGWLAGSGVLGLVLGVVGLAFSGVTIIYAAILLGVGVLVQAGLEIAATRADTGPAGPGWLVAFGVLAVIAGGTVLASAGAGIVL